MLFGAEKFSLGFNIFFFFFFFWFCLFYHSISECSGAYKLQHTNTTEISISQDPQNLGNQTQNYFKEILGSEVILRGNLQPNMPF